LISHSLSPFVDHYSQSTVYKISLVEC